jgi:hypothetical protein
MRQIVQTIWWWVRVALIVVVGVYAMLSLWNNTGKSIQVWYWFGRVEETSIVALALASFLLGGVLCSTGLALASATIRYRRTREHRRLRLIEERREMLAKKAAMLRTKPPPAPIVKVKEPPKEPPREIESELAPIVVEHQASKLVRPTQERVPERMELVDMPKADTTIAVETHRATPFASTPAIDPRAKVAEPLPIVEQADSLPSSRLLDGDE